MAASVRAPVHVRAAPHALLVALGGGIAAPLWLAAPPAGATAAAVSAAAALALACRAAGGPAAATLALTCIALALAGWAWGGARMQATAPGPPPEPGLVRGAVVVDTPPVPDGHGGWRMRARAAGLAGPGGAGMPPGRRLLLTVRGAPAPDVGARLAVRGRLRAAADSTAPGWWRRWLERQGIAARLSARAPEVTGRRGGLTGVRDRWRTWAGDNAAAGLAGDTAGLVRGMALGGGAQLSEAAATAFRDAGIWHLLAVSGQNVTVVALAVLWLLRSLGVAHRAALAAAALVMVAYCLACDGGASVARAGTVGALALAAELRGGARERWMLMLGGLVLLLAWQPRALHDPGLQLSFGAVAGLFAAGPPLAAWLRGWLPGVLADLAAMAVAAGLATAPVIVAHFGRLSLVGFAVNVVAVPLAAPVVVLALAGLAAGVVHPLAGSAAAHAAGLGADLLLAIARLASAVPGATVALPGIAALPLAALAAAPAVAGWWLAAPPSARRGPGIRALLVAAACLAASAWAAWPRAAPVPWPARAAVTALDVGQGDAILVRGPAGDAILVDAGPPGEPAAAVRALRRQGVRRVDLLVITHPDADHVGGAADVLRAVRVGALVHAPAPADGWNAAMSATIALARRRGTPAVTVRAGDALRAGPWTARVLWPEAAPAAGADANAASVVMDARGGGLGVLLTGDAEGDVLARLPLRPAHLLKVSHHGSADAHLPDVLARVRPRAALISAGAGNPFGHPHAQVVGDLAAAGARVWRTDRHGDVTLPAGPGAAVPSGG